MIERINIRDLHIAPDSYPLSVTNAPVVHMRIYWGCTTYGCDRGFPGGPEGAGSAEDMPRDWAYCPACGGELAEIKSLTPDSEFRS